MAKQLSGGGLHSNKLVQAKTPKVEPRSRAISPGAVSKLGMATAEPKPKLDAGRGYSTPKGPSSNMGQGPGANRTVTRAGSQSKTPAVKPLPLGRWGGDRS
jgi:hypothetical protein